MREPLKLHLVSKRDPTLTCCGWQTRGRAAQLVTRLDDWPPDRQCKLCLRRRRFASSEAQPHP